MIPGAPAKRPCRAPSCAPVLRADDLTRQVTHPNARTTITHWTLSARLQRGLLSALSGRSDARGIAEPRVAAPLPRTSVHAPHAAHISPRRALVHLCELADPTAALARSPCARARVPYTGLLASIAAMTAGRPIANQFPIFFLSPIRVICLRPFILIFFYERTNVKKRNAS